MSRQGNQHTTGWRSLPEDRRYQCTQSIDGTLCGQVFKRAWNLRRHVQVKHRREKPATGSTFLVKRGPATGPSLDLPLSRHPVATGVTPPVLVENQMPPGQLRLPPLVRDRPTPPSHLPGLSTPASTPQSPRAGSGPPNTVNLGREQWLGRGRFRDAMPAYEVPSSKKYPGQQRGLQWLSKGGKDSMDAFVTRIMASWGVKTTHSGTCIVWPQDWQALEPEALAGLLTFENTPPIDSDRSMYKHDDHMTTTARAIAWFAHWPRTGIQLDNFLEHASLTMFEACAIQIFVFRDSYGLPQSLPSRPPWHRYPTFENQLPLGFAPRDAAVRLRPHDQTALPAEGGGPRRPAIVCQLCSRIKSFNKVAALWSHVRKKHADRSIEDRLQEVRRSAALWGSYLKTTRTNPIDPTVIKLAEISRDDFSWDVVKGWPM
ncbi:hypothetical protein GQX73_g10292 [Xylaria multiplex]|uniref:C2H2-type domain-containing protein n=1 Tax=Xylaria multiplex TaxID=323545 RepID=A0A7C8ILD3_9PEZI|nr:hypothetical protein GQX73_g10292 [Xylaria multiplex]